MKKLSFLALAAAGLMMVGCSDKDVVAEDVKQVINSEDGKQFIALNINLPVDNGFATRSEDVTDDNNYGDGTFELNDGLESEYTVNDATLIVFHPATGEGKTEYDATFVAAYNINPEPWTMSADHQVTDYSTKIVQKVGTTVVENDLALVILNKNDLFSLENKTFKVGNVEFTADKTFKDLQEALATAAKGGKNAADEMKSNGFYMANAPLADKAGSSTTEPTGAKVQTLVKIKNVYETEDEAREGECAEIYVERGMAKVTLQPTVTTSTLGTKYDTGETETVTVGEETTTQPVLADLNLTIDGWVLDHTNASSYLVRSTADHDKFADWTAAVNKGFIGLVNPDVNKYRYIGISPITEGDPDTYMYRTYFAKDPNYTATFSTMGEKMSGLTYLTLSALDNSLSNKFGDSNPLYCFENTFDVAHQSVNNTTVVRLKVTAKTGANAEDLYIINGNKSTIYKEDDVKTLIATKCVELVKAAGVETKNADTKIEATDFTVTLDNTRDADGFKNIASITFNIGAKVSDATADLVPTAATLLANVKKLYKDNTVGQQNGSILCYEGGVSYYTIRIKHFGDQLTPWKKANTACTPAPTLENGSYPNFNAEAVADRIDCANNYLGRYGVLRNNWYDIKINSIKYLGEAVPVDYSNDPTPDDEIDGYIAVQINILSWAKRTQSWNL